MLSRIQCVRHKASVLPEVFITCGWAVSFFHETLLREWKTNAPVNVLPLWFSANLFASFDILH